MGPLVRSVIRGAAVWAAAVALGACASAPGPSATEVSARVYRMLAGPSVVGGLEVSLQGDYVFERFTLVRAQTPKGPAPYAAVGVSLGNGLFLDNAGNLAVRADALLGLGAASVAKTRWTPAQGPAQTVTYDGRKLVVEPGVPGPWGPVYSVVPTASPVTLPNLQVTTDTSGTVTVDHRDVLVENQTWTPVTGGYTRTLPLQRTQTIVLSRDGVADDLGRLSVTAEGDHLVVSYRPGAAPEYRVRIYRTPTLYLIVDDRTGEATSLALTPTSVSGPGGSLVVQDAQKR